MASQLHQSFSNLPEPIIDWLTSDSVTDRIIKINQRLGLEGILLRILPNLILRLVVKDIKPENFITKLIEEFDLEFNLAATIANEINIAIFKPIENLLR